MTQLTEEQHDQLMVRCSCGQRVPRAEIEAVLAERDKVALLDSDSQAVEQPADNMLNMVWAEEAGVALYVYRGEREDRRVVEIRSGAKVLATATIAVHNRDNLAETISTGGLRYAPAEVAKLANCAATAMRDKCVEKLREMLSAWKYTDEEVIAALESLTLDQVKPEKQ